jgi:hypothetical protein
MVAEYIKDANKEGITNKGVKKNLVNNLLKGMIKYCALVQIDFYT